MTDMPERLLGDWADKLPKKNIHLGDVRNSPSGQETEYVRSDIHAAAIARAEKAEGTCVEWSEASQRNYRFAIKAIAERDAMKVENARLVAAMKWQPIKTAPKDGTRVLLGGGKMFCEALERDVIEPISAQWDVDTWLVAGTEGGFVCATVDGPTHWMPLPAPPTP